MNTQKSTAYPSGFCVNSRNLHANLGIGRDYSNWFKDRMVKPGLVKDVDFTVVKRPRGCIDYFLAWAAAEKVRDFETDRKAIKNSSKAGRAIKKAQGQIESTPEPTVRVLTAATEAIRRRVEEALSPAPDPFGGQTIPPEGFMLFGRGPLTHISNRHSDDVMAYHPPDSTKWEAPNRGCHPAALYALRAGSEIAAKNRLFAGGTIEYWLAKLPEPYATKALRARTEDGNSCNEGSSLAVSLRYGFYWASSREGYYFWARVEKLIREGLPLPDLKPDPVSEPDPVSVESVMPAEIQAPVEAQAPKGVPSPEPPVSSPVEALVATEPPSCPPITTQTGPLMSSLEIASLTGKRHANVMRDIESTLAEAGISQLKFESAYSDAQGKERPCYFLPRRECDLVMSGYSVPYRLLIIDRWRELEAMVKQPLEIPTHSETLRLWADSLDAQKRAEKQALEYRLALEEKDQAFVEERRKSEERGRILLQLDEYTTEKEELIAELEEESAQKSELLAKALPKAKALEILSDSDSLFCVRDAASDLGVREKLELIPYLIKHKWIYYRTSWTTDIPPREKKILRAHGHAKEKGFVVQVIAPKLVNGEIRHFDQAKITGAGMKRLALDIEKIKAGI